MAPNICEPYKLEEMKQFFTGFMYREEAFLLDEIVRLDGERREVAAVMNTERDLPYARFQRPGPGHPAHVSAAELIMSTANLGCLHAWFFYGCRWEEGWVGFGNRIHRADFRALATLGPPLKLRSREIQSRIGSRRIMLRFEFEFSQEGRRVYFGDQSALFVKGSGA